MSPRPGLPASRQATIALCLLLVGVGVACVCAATADAARYKALICAAATGAQNPTLAATPGFFDFHRNCGTAYGDPAGDGGYLRLEDNTGGTAGSGDEASYSWRAPSDTAIAAVDLYTRQPLRFNAGWRTRVWTEDFSDNWHNVLIQGSGVQNSGLNARSTSYWAPHPWPFAGYGDYKRLYVALRCYRPAGCDRDGRNVSDANSILLTLTDKREPEVDFRDTALSRGEWVRGERAVSWREADEGSGLRYARLRVDGGPLGDAVVSHGCDVGHSDANGEFAAELRPCSTGPFTRHYGLNTEDLADGTHEMSVCAQDFGQYQHVQGSATETCDTATIRTDNTAPGAPASLEVTSANPERYLPEVGARWELPPDPGSPIERVHYSILDAKGKVIVPEKTVAGEDRVALSDVGAPEEPGAYRLRVVPEDAVGYRGRAATVPLPRDTTPPAAPQDLRVVADSLQRRVERFGLRWRNLADRGAPIAQARYRLLDGDGKVVVPVRVARGPGIEAIGGVDTPDPEDDYVAEVWLMDGEGNVGAKAEIPLPRDTTPPAAPQRVSVTAPDTSRSEHGFDVHWEDISDAGSPIVAAHYEVRDAAGKVVVGRQTIRGKNPERIERLRTPRERGTYTLRLWLEDAEGNVGAPSRAPLSYSCRRSEAEGAAQLSAELRGASALTVQQGEGATLRGRLRGSHGGVSGAPLCVFSQLVTGGPREFLGLAVTGSGGAYGFAIGAGASRQLSAVYRPGQRRLQAHATLRTRVKPTLRARSRLVYTGEYAYLSGEVPGPGNDGVTVVVQVKQGDGWLAFRRYRARGGRFAVKYPFLQTSKPTVYAMRAEVRKTVGYPYVQGTSDVLRLRVLPASMKPKRRRCASGRRWVAHPRRGKPRCVAWWVGIGRRCLRARRLVRRHPQASRPRRVAHRTCSRAKRVRRARRLAQRRRAGRSAAKTRPTRGSGRAGAAGGDR